MTARFATTPIGPSLLVPSDGAGVLVTTAADDLSVARIARSDVALDTGTAGAEFVFYGEAESVGARIGVVTPAARFGAPSHQRFTWACMSNSPGSAMRPPPSISCSGLPCGAPAGRIAVIRSRNT